MKAGLEEAKAPNASKSSRARSGGHHRAIAKARQTCLTLSHIRSGSMVRLKSPIPLSNGIDIDDADWK